MTLSSKVSIITGASSGLGLATAILFARRGAMITLCGRDQERLKEAHDQCTQASGGHADRFITVSGDVTDASIRKDIVAKTIQKFGCLDILVPNAGTTARGESITNATEESFDLVFNVNLKSAFFLIQEALPHLEMSKGNIVSVSSMLSTLVCAQAVIYSISKSAVDHMTRCLAIDLGPKGVRVNAVNPSFIPTRLWREYEGERAYESALKFAESERPFQPLNGEYGKAEDVAEAICFLASDASKFITGECLLVDGGRSFMAPFGSN